MVSYKKLVSVYLPEELYQALIAYQEQLGFEEPSDAFVKILAQFFHKDSQVKRYATVEQLEALEGKVAQLSEQLALVSPILARTTTTQAPKTASAFNNDYARPTLTAQPPSVAFRNSDLEEEYEEPDEILYDFLERGGSPS
jgi:hypothetical protein